MGRSGGGCGLSSMTQILHGLGVRWTKEFKALRSQLWWGGQGMMVGEGRNWWEQDGAGKCKNTAKLVISLHAHDA
ncbi:unnamed protein product [Prunus armeniaca]